MKVRIATLCLCLWAMDAWCADNAVLLSAYATSRSVDSADPICLLDQACKGYWSPGAKDNGVNDGLYYQFEFPIHVSYILVHFRNAMPSGYAWPVRFYIDGKTTSPDRKVYLAEEAEDAQTMRIGVRADFGEANPSAMTIGNPRTTVPLSAPIQSLFLCVDQILNERPEIDRIQFLAGASDQTLQPISIQLPTSAAARVTATSVLDPFPAYQPAHLFDSRIDLSWATNGLKTNGINESFTVEFETSQESNALIIWNGYQRSSTHYQANGRVRAAEVKTEDGMSEKIQLRDREGPQRISLAHTRKARRWTFTIKEIVPGSKYRDVLISEVRLVQPSGQLLLPRVELQATPAPAAWAPLMDRSWTSILKSIEAPGDCGGPVFNDRFRIRSDGTFIVYTGKDIDPGDNRVSARVLEGNWEPKGDQIRIFGKKYSTDIVTSEYLNESHTSAPAIFQSLVTLKRYRAMSTEEKRNVLATTSRSSDEWDIDVSTDGKKNVVQANGLNAFIAKADRILSAVNPYFVQSPDFTALLLPTDDVSSAGGGCE